MKQATQELSEDKGQPMEPIPDVRSLMAQIRSRIAQELEDEAAQCPSREIPAWQPEHLDLTAGDGEARAGQLRFSEDLRTLNERYSRGLGVDPLAVTTHRSGIIGRCIIALKRRFRALVWDLLKGHFAAEREFQGALIRYLNLTSTYVDARDARNFWELIRKIDVDTAKAMERVERFEVDTGAGMQALEGRLRGAIDCDLGDLRTRLAEVTALVKTDSQVVAGLEGIIARLGRPVAAANTLAVANDPISTPSPTTTPDYSYLLLENRFRGSEAEIASRVNAYVPLLEGRPGSIVEIGCGRGELLDALRQRGVSAYGVDMDRAMIERCIEQGLTVHHGDGIAHLAHCPDRSLGGVIAIQVVEHLQRGDLEQFLRLAAVKVAPGGVVVCETINPRSLLALSSNYFRDPTHVWPIHPDTLKYQMELAGLTVNEVKFLSPVPESARLPAIPVSEFLMPSELGVVRAVNRVVGQLNELLYGYQDYAIVAQVPN